MRHCKSTGANAVQSLLELREFSSGRTRLQRVLFHAETKADRHVKQFTCLATGKVNDKFIHPSTRVAPLITLFAFGGARSSQLTTPSFSLRAAK